METYLRDAHHSGTAILILFSNIEHKDRFPHPRNVMDQLPKLKEFFSTDSCRVNVCQSSSIS